MNTWLRTSAAIAVLAAATIATTVAWADKYPSRTITIIVPASPGGVTDMLGRILAQHIIADWGAQAVVENKPGANNQVAAEYVTHQPGDGYTLFVGPETTFIVNPTLYPHLAYDPVKGFTPITGLVQIYHALILNPSVPANNVKSRRRSSMGLPVPGRGASRRSTGSSTRCAATISWCYRLATTTRSDWLPRRDCSRRTA